MDQGKHYYAFISHSSKDEKIALWLRDQLVSYNIPVSVQKEYNAPKRLRPVFAYQTDLAGNLLNDALGKELQDSQYLIVICSPSGAKSDYVNGEVRYFIDTGRVDKIIPFIVDGEPHAQNPEEECFTPSMLHAPVEFRGANLKDLAEKLGSKRGAVVNVIATMLGVRFDALWDIYKRKQKRKHIFFTCLSVLLVALALFVWDYKRPTYQYFVDYVDCWGVPEGVIELSKEQVSHRGGTYQFEFRRVPFGEPKAYSWRVSKVSYINSALWPQEIGHTEMKDRYPIQEIEYNKTTGVVQRINYCDAKGKVLLRHELSERDGVTAAVADFRNAQEQLGSGFVGASLSSMSMSQMDAGQQKANIVRYVYERDSQGHIVKQTYHANNDYNLQRSAMRDANGIFGCQYTLDSLGRRIKVEYLGWEGEKASTKKGVAGRALEYDSHGNLTRATYLDFKAHPVCNEKMWASAIDLFDENGNVVEESYLGPDGKRCLADLGWYRVTVKYDDRGNQIEAVYFGTDDEMCFSNEGLAKWTAEYDDRGNMVEMALFGTEGEPCICNYGYAKRTSKYNDRGNVIEEAYFGTDGDLCFNNDGVAKWTAKYDDRGNVIEEAYFGTDGELCFNNDGVAKWTAKYDDRGNQIEEAFLGTDGKPCFSNEGIAKRTSKYDDRGNLIEEAYYGTDGEPCLCNDLVAKRAVKYDDRGNCIEEVCCGTDGEPCMAQNGYSKVVKEYDDHGNIIKQMFSDVYGKPCFESNGVCVNICKYDQFNNRIESAYYDQEGNPCCSTTDNSFKWKAKYDERGNKVEVSFYGIDENLCISNYGCAKETFKYDDRGNQVEASYFGIDGKLCLNNAGFARITLHFDDRGNQVEASYFGIDGKPCLNNDGCAKMTMRYDNKGNRIEYAYWGVNGKLCVINDGCAKMTLKYDDKGNVVEAAYFDVDDEPVIDFPEGIHKWIYSYDNRGNVVERRFYGINNELCANNEGIAILRRAYDACGHVIESTCFDTLGKKSVCNYDFYKMIHLYDERGNRTETEFQDTIGNPVDANGYYKSVTTFNERNEVMDVLYYNSSNELILQQVGSEIIIQVYGWALHNEIPLYCILLQLNDWVIGDPLNRLSAEHQSSRYGKKELYLMTPEGEIRHYYVENGLLGIQFENYSIEKSRADQWRVELEKWKKEN